MFLIYISPTDNICSADITATGGIVDHFVETKGGDITAAFILISILQLDKIDKVKAKHEAKRGEAALAESAEY